MKLQICITLCFSRVIFRVLRDLFSNHSTVTVFCRRNVSYIWRLRWLGLRVTTHHSLTSSNHFIYQINGAACKPSIMFSIIKRSKLKRSEGFYLATRFTKLNPIRHSPYYFYNLLNCNINVYRNKFVD